MPSFSRNDVVLVAYPFSDRNGSKVRPAVIVSGPHRSRDLFVVPLTSRADRMVEGEFSLADWRNAGLNMASVAKTSRPRRSTCKTGSRDRASYHMGRLSLKVVAAGERPQSIGRKTHSDGRPQLQ
jgi:mRNA-degrading endonuclease toxin of MazEF toxin-antitoxin module